MGFCVLVGCIPRPRYLITRLSAFQSKFSPGSRCQTFILENVAPKKILKEFAREFQVSHRRDDVDGRME